MSGAPEDKVEIKEGAASVSVVFGKYGKIEYCKADKVFLEIKKAMLLYYLNTKVGVGVGVSTTSLIMGEI